MSSLSVSLDDYLKLRRGLGHKLDASGRHLAKFVSYMEAAGEQTVTLDSALGFVFEPGVASSASYQRLTAVRGFARYLSGIDPATEVPPAGLVTYKCRRRSPFIFTDTEVNAVVSAVRASTPFPLRAAALSTMIGLLAATGLRIGEAIRLDCDDIDWDQAVLMVRDTKFAKDRDVPVSASTIEALRSYRRRRDRSHPATTRFFVSLRGTPVAYTHFQSTFHQGVADSGIAIGSAVFPRVHDLRHSFAVRTLLGWYRQGLDVEALLPRLSTYLGHREPRFTYRYLSATPELLGHAAERLEGFLEAAR